MGDIFTVVHDDKAAAVTALAACEDMCFEGAAQGGILRPFRYGQIGIGTEDALCIAEFLGFGGRIDFKIVHKTQNVGVRRQNLVVYGIQKPTGGMEQNNLAA